MKDSFYEYHPLVNFTFYIFVLSISMFFLHPVLLVISLISSISYLVYLKGKKSLITIFLIAFPIFIFSSIFNPLFSHEGNTILFYTTTQNPVTLESIVYGIVSGLGLFVVIVWFSSFNHVITSDKIIYLFGKICPSVSLLISMILRFIPRFNNQLKKVQNTQKAFFKQKYNKGYIKKLKNVFKTFSIMVTWSLENAVETSDSMTSRGYGLKNRSHYHNYKLQKRDIVVLSIMIICFISIILCIIFEKVLILYFPIFYINELSIYSSICYISYFILSFLPLILNIMEDAKWHYLKSKI